MTRADAFNTLAQDFKAWIAATYPALKAAVAFPDMDFTPPAPGSPWVRWHLAWSGTMASGTGRAHDAHTGLLFVELYWPSGFGYRDVNAMADAVALHYRTFSADGGRLLTRGNGDSSRPWVSTPPREAGYTRRTVNVPVRLFEPIP